jgi:biopolymer transport protein ExbD
MINLIDIMLLLLLFFILTTTFQSAQQKAIEYQLPKAQTGGAAPPLPALEFIVTGDGAIHHGGVVLDEAALEALIERGSATEDQRSRPVIIRADAQARHGKVVYLMDALRRRGLTRLAIGVAEPGK